MDNTGKIPRFISKLYSILNEPKNSTIIKWTHEGNAFQIADLHSFNSEILLKHFNSIALSSFVRQLNIYDFHKASLPISSTSIYEYANTNFNQHKPKLLCLIKRKGNSSQALSRCTDSTKADKAAIGEIKSRLNALSSQLEALQLRIKLSEGKHEFLDYCHTDLAKRNHTIQMELYALTEKERSLEYLFSYVMQNYFQKAKVVDNSLQCFSSKVVEKKSDIVSNAFRTIQCCLMRKSVIPLSVSGNEQGENCVKITNMMKALSNSKASVDAMGEMSYSSQLKEFQRRYLSTIDECSSYSCNSNAVLNEKEQEKKRKTLGHNNLVEDNETRPQNVFLQLKTARNSKE